MCCAAKAAIAAASGATPADSCQLGHYPGPSCSSPSQESALSRSCGLRSTASALCRMAVKDYCCSCCRCGCSCCCFCFAPSWSVSACPCLTVLPFSFFSSFFLCFFLLFFASCSCCFANNAEAAKLLIIVLYTFYFVMLDTHIVALPSLKALFTSEWENIWVKQHSFYLENII